MKCIIMRGLPGSGKSTYLREHYADAFVCSADHFFESGGEYRFDGSKLKEAHASCLVRFVEAVRSGVPVVAVDNTNLEITNAAPYYAIAEAYGYDVEVVEIHVRASIAAKRNVHGVPFDSVLRMVRRFEPAPSRWKVVRHDGFDPPAHG